MQMYSVCGSALRAIIGQNLSIVDLSQGNTDRQRCTSYSSLGAVQKCTWGKVNVWYLSQKQSTNTEHCTRLPDADGGDNQYISHRSRAQVNTFHFQHRDNALKYSMLRGAKAILLVNRSQKQSSHESQFVSEAEKFRKRSLCSKSLFLYQCVDVVPAYFFPPFCGMSPAHLIPGILKLQIPKPFWYTARKWTTSNLVGVQPLDTRERDGWGDFLSV